MQEGRPCVHVLLITRKRPDDSEVHQKTDRSNSHHHTALNLRGIGQTNRRLHENPHHDSEHGKGVDKGRKGLDTGVSETVIRIGTFGGNPIGKKR